MTLWFWIGACLGVSFTMSFLIAHRERKGCFWVIGGLSFIAWILVTIQEAISK